jgi:Holliday junction resolvase RusA-like endonuclease
MIFRVTVPGVPVPQGRPRLGRTWRGRSIVHSPIKATVWRTYAQGLYLKTIHDFGLPRPVFKAGPVALRVLAVFPCPKGWHRVRVPVATRPYTAQENDGDNIAKAAQDAGKGLLWTDDGQVAFLVVERWWAAQGEEPFVQLVATEWTPAARGAA